MVFLIGVVKYLLLPSSMVMICALLGLVMLCTRLPKVWGLALCALSVSGYIIFATGPIAMGLLGYLEYQIPSASIAERVGARTIVVLAAHAERDLAIPLSSRINEGAAFRLIETISLFQSGTNPAVIVTGEGDTPHIMKEVLVSAGIPSAHITVDDQSWSTYESGRNLAPALGDVPFLLVTSAGHMPRAIKVFRKAGTNPCAVPTHFLTRSNWMAIQYLPSPRHLVYSDLAVSEYEALVWYAINGWI